VNIEIGALRGILKQFKLWHLVGENYKPLPEPKEIGRALSPEQELRLFAVASSRGEWNVAFWVSLISANPTAARLRDQEPEIARHTNGGEDALRQGREEQVPGQDNCPKPNRLVGGRAAARPGAQVGSN
jgi:hypothetical protein